VGSNPASPTDVLPQDIVPKVSQFGRFRGLRSVTAFSIGKSLLAELFRREFVYAG
jgi:hypothetical protein